MSIASKIKVKAAMKALITSILVLSKKQVTNAIATLPPSYNGNLYNGGSLTQLNFNTTTVDWLPYIITLNPSSVRDYHNSAFDCRVIYGKAMAHRGVGDSTSLTITPPPPRVHVHALEDQTTKEVVGIFRSEVLSDTIRRTFTSSYFDMSVNQIIHVEQEQYSDRFSGNNNWLPWRVKYTDAVNHYFNLSLFNGDNDYYPVALGNCIKIKVNADSVMSSLVFQTEAQLTTAGELKHSIGDEVIFHVGEGKLTLKPGGCTIVMRAGRKAECHQGGVMRARYIAMNQWAVDGDLELI